MHELGLCAALADAVVRRAAGRRVDAVRVRIGGHPVDPDVINQGFLLAAAGTVAENARVDVVLEPMALRCRGCGHTPSAEDPLATYACPECGGVDIEVTGSDHVMLESVTLAADEIAASREASAPWTR